MTGTASSPGKLLAVVYPGPPTVALLPDGTVRIWARDGRLLTPITPPRATPDVPAPAGGEIPPTPA